MAKPAVFHPVFVLQVMCLASMAMVPHAQMSIDSEATMTSLQKSSMMRREAPQQSSARKVASETTKEGNVQLRVNAGGSQEKLSREATVAGDQSEKLVRKHPQAQTSRIEGIWKGDSMMEVEDSSAFGTAAEEQEQLDRTQASAIPDMNRGLSLQRKRDQKDDENGLFSEDAAAALLQESDAAFVEDQKKQDEELYYKLFPEERPGAAEAAALLESSTKSFRIRVPVSGGGKKLCLTEDIADRQVRAEPCRQKEKRQKWYWSGEKLLNLHSIDRCLGVDKRKKPKERKEHHIQGHSLSMNFKCSLKHAPLSWALTETGQLQSNYNKHCMAINEMEDFAAMVLPCGYDNKEKQ